MAPHLKLLHEPSDAELLTAERENAQGECPHNLELPTFTFAGVELVKRLTLIARAGRIEEVFYPVFPSDADAGRVVAWLNSHMGA